MNESVPASTSTEYRAPALLRGMALFCLLFSPILAFISFMAWWVEGAPIGLWTLPLWLGMMGYWFWQWRVWARRMRVYTDRLELLTPLAKPKTLDYAQITALNLGRGVLRIVTQQEYISIRGDTNTLALLAAHLETAVPTLRKASERQPLLPIIVKAQRQSILLVNVFGLLIAALGVGLTNAAVADVEFESRAFAIGFGIAMIGIGGMLLYWLLVTFVWHYRFEHDQIEARHTFGVDRYQPALLQQITMQQRNVTHRGITRTLYTLQMDFTDGRKLIIQPGAQNYPLEYAEVHEKLLLEKLLAQLTAAYRSELQSNTAVAESIPAADKSDDSQNEAPATEAPPLVTRSELDPANLPWEDVSAPDYAFQLHSIAANLTVSVLNYGERQPGAETIEIRLSSPVEGESLFRTTNGNALFSESGLLLLLHDSFLPIVIDTATLRAWHYKIADRTFLISPQWEGDTLRGSTLAYGKRMPDAEPFGPWSREEIIQQWQPGLDSWATTTTDRTVNTRRHRRSAAANATPANLPIGISEHLWRRLNFIELNPDWVMLGDGAVFAAKEEYRLPSDLGEHLVGGEVQLVDEAGPRRAAFVMDSALGGVAAIYIKKADQWQRLSAPVEWLKPHVNFANLDEVISAQMD